MAIAWSAATCLLRSSLRTCRYAARCSGRGTQARTLRGLIFSSRCRRMLNGPPVSRVLGPAEDARLCLARLDRRALRIYACPLEGAPFELVYLELELLGGRVVLGLGIHVGLEVRICTVRHHHERGGRERGRGAADRRPSERGARRERCAIIEERRSATLFSHLFGRNKGSDMLSSLFSCFPPPPFSSTSLSLFCRSLPPL